jgi:hypothetical protein
MKTQTLLKQIKKSFNVSGYWLEKFLNINHGLFSQYLKGIYEARFSVVLQWLNRLGLFIKNDKIYFKLYENKSIDKLDKTLLNTLFNSNLDNVQWIEEGKEIEQKEGHKIFWDTRHKK